MSTRDIDPCVDCVYDPTLSRHGVRRSNNDTILHGIYSIGRHSLSCHAPHEAPHNPGCFTKMHCNDVIMSGMTSQIVSVSIVYSIVCSGADQRKDQNSAALAFVRGIHRWPVNSPHKGPVTRKMLPFDDVIMECSIRQYIRLYMLHSFVFLYEQRFGDVRVYNFRLVSDSPRNSPIVQIGE